MKAEMPQVLELRRDGGRVRWGLSPCRMKNICREEYVVKSKKTNGPLVTGYRQKSRHLSSVIKSFLKLGP